MGKYGNWECLMKHKNITTTLHIYYYWSLFIDSILLQINHNYKNQQNTKYFKMNISRVFNHKAIATISNTEHFQNCKNKKFPSIFLLEH